MKAKERIIPEGFKPVKRRGINAVVFVNKSRLSAMAFKDKARKPYFYYRFQSEATMEKHIGEFYDMVKREEAAAKERADRIKNFKNPLKVGDIVYDSWGYDQTNIDWFQVVEVLPKSVKIRAINGCYKETGFMSGNTMPVKDSFKSDEIILKRVKPSWDGKGVNLPSAYGCCSLWDGQPKYESHYA